MDNITFKKVLDDGELFDQQANYEGNFEKINQEVVPKITELQDGKVDKVTGKGLSTNDFDNTYKQKIDIDIPAQLADKVQNFKIKNEVVNGGFTNGVTGWTAAAGSASLGAENNSLLATGAGASASISIYQTVIPAVVGQKIYVKATAYCDNALSTAIQLILGDNVLGSPSQFIAKSIAAPEQNKEYILDALMTITTQSGNLRLYINNLYNNASDKLGKKLTIKKPILVNLTSIFGAGNEPTIEEMDRLVSMVPNQWWDGELDLSQQQYVNLILNLIREKANKAQEAWITPSLVNGATHSGRPLQYRLNEIGQLELRGELSSAPSVLATTIFSVSGKYLPKTNNGGVVSRNNAFARVQLSLAGNFNQTAGATTGALNVDGLTINVG